MDPSILENKIIQHAKKVNKESKNQRRLGPDVQYDIELERENTKTQKETTIYDILKPIVMLKDNKEYNLYEALNNTNAGITFAQLFSVSPSLRKLCAKGLKLNPDDVRQIKTIRNFSIVEGDPLISDTLEELKYSMKDDTLNPLNCNSDLINHIFVTNKVDIATVLGSVDNTSAKVLIDTGSNVNAINISFYKKIEKNHKLITKNIAYFKLASNQIISSNNVTFLSLKFGNLTINTMFWILNDEDMCYDIILGRRSQKEHRLYIDPDDDCLYKKNDNGATCVATPTNIPENGNVIAKISLFYDIKNDFLFHPKLKNLIKEFDDILINSVDNVKVANSEPHSIPLLKNTPIKLRPYKISLDQSIALKKEITKLLNIKKLFPLILLGLFQLF